MALVDQRMFDLWFTTGEKPVLHKLVTTVTIPVTVLIGKDGTVQSYHSGSTDDARAAIRQDAAALVRSKTLVPAAGK